MKKLMTIMLGLSLLGGAVAVAQTEAPAKTEKKTKAKSTKAPKKAKKTEEKK